MGALAAISTFGRRIMGRAGPEVETAHHGASRQARDLMSWLPSRLSPDAALLPDLEALVARSEDLTRNSGIASGAEQTQVDNIVGGGLRLVALPDYRALGRSKEWADEWSDQVEAQWRSFADTVEIDAARRMTFSGLTRLVMRTVLADGDALALVLWLEGRPSSRWNTVIQLVDPARLSTPSDRLSDPRIRGGVEVDRYGGPVAYWVAKENPGDRLLPMGSVLAPEEWVRIPARMPFGRRRAIHVLPTTRIGQNRGKPLVSAIMRDFKMLDHYQREELRTAVVHSMIAAFLETPLDQESMVTMLGGGAEDYDTYLRQWRVQLQGGAVIPTPPGTKITPFTPTRPGGVYEQFVTSTLRNMAVGLNIPYELLSKDFSKTNYSSARAALLEAWRYFSTQRQWLSVAWAQPVYELWLEEAVNAGAVEAPDFYGNRVAWSRCKWIGAGRGWIDPVKEAQAAALRIENGTSTLEIECAESTLR